MMGSGFKFMQGNFHLYLEMKRRGYELVGA